MHACGHDGHMAGLLTAVKVLYESKADLKGTLKILFQPAEEGYGGAQAMIEAGVLESGAYGPHVDEVYGLHLWTVEPLGEVLVYTLYIILYCIHYILYIIYIIYICYIIYIMYIYYIHYIIYIIYIYIIYYIYYIYYIL